MALLDWSRLLSRRPAQPGWGWLLRTYGFSEGAPCTCGHTRCDGATIPATGRREDGVWVEFCAGGSRHWFHDHHLAKTTNALRGGEIVVVRDD